MVTIEAECTACGKKFSYCVSVAGRKKRSLCEECKAKKQKYGEVLAIKEEVKKKKGFEGLWKGRTGWYRSKAFLKKDIENLLLGDKDRKCIILRYNKYHKAEGNTPNFIFAFADARDADMIVQEMPFQTPDRLDEDDEDKTESISPKYGVLDDMLDCIPSEYLLEEMKDGFSFDSYQNLLAEVKFGVDEKLKQRTYKHVFIKKDDNGEEYEEPKYETHYIAVVFPNGDELHRFDTIAGVPYSAIYTKDENGQCQEMWSNTREGELGMVIWYLENQIREPVHGNV